MSDAKEKIPIEDMIEAIVDHAEFCERQAENFRGMVNCDHRAAERRAKTFRAAAQTLDLVQMFEKPFVEMVRSSRSLSRGRSKG